MWVGGGNAPGQQAVISIVHIQSLAIFFTDSNSVFDFEIKHNKPNIHEERKKQPQKSLVWTKEEKDARKTQIVIVWDPRFSFCFGPLQAHHSKQHAHQHKYT